MRDLTASFVGNSLAKIQKKPTIEGVIPGGGMHFFYQLQFWFLNRSFKGTYAESIGTALTCIKRVLSFQAQNHFHVHVHCSSFYML